MVTEEKPKPLEITKEETGERENENRAASETD
jgi:hypothetical protein